MPLRAEGMSKAKAFLMGILSGAVEPAAALLTIMAAGLIIPVLPYDLGSPLSGTQWMIPYIYVHPEYSYQDIGYTFIAELIKAAKEANIKQLVSVCLDEQSVDFWYNNGFNICACYIMRDSEGKIPVSAGLRII